MLLLILDGFLNALRDKLSEGSEEEKYAAVVMLWSLAVNNQRAKVVLKSADLLVGLEEFARHRIALASSDSKEVLVTTYVLHVLKGD